MTESMSNTRLNIHLSTVSIVTGATTTNHYRNDDDEEEEEDVAMTLR